ncbi:MAG: hypothetical protein R3321_02205, partial [Nitrososphaeraceae archaeon]|nr:hypothetical protein [Nitrososphaeraceae archaeon]
MPYTFVYGDVQQKLNKVQNCKDSELVNEIVSNIKEYNQPINDTEFFTFTADVLDNNYGKESKQSNDLINFHHIKKFDMSGNLIDSWGIKGIKKGEFLHPHGIASDSKGDIYVSDAILCN